MSTPYCALYYVHDWTAMYVVLIFTSMNSCTCRSIQTIRPLPSPTHTKIIMLEHNVLSLFDDELASILVFVFLICDDRIAAYARAI